MTKRQRRTRAKRQRHAPVFRSIQDDSAALAARIERGWLGRLLHR